MPPYNLMFSPLLSEKDKNIHELCYIFFQLRQCSAVSQYTLICAFMMTQKLQQKHFSEKGEKVKDDESKKGRGMLEDPTERRQGGGGALESLTKERCGVDCTAFILGTQSWSLTFPHLYSSKFREDGRKETWVVLEEQNHLPPGLPNRNL